MTTRHLVDTELLPLLDLFGDLHVDAQSLPAIRSMGAGAASGVPPVDPQPEILQAPGPNGAPDVTVRLTRPSREASGSRAAVLHIHGGGFVLGSAAMLDAAARERADRHDVVVAAVDYRLAPETPFPGPLEDCYAVLEWLVDQAERFGLDPYRIVVMGESAGGGLAAALALLARDRGGPKLAGQILVYPMIDDRVGGPEDPWRNANTGEFVWSHASNRFGWEAMRGGEALPAERLGHFAPARAADLSGLPSTFVAVGALDLFLDENLDYARRLAAAGVRVEAHVYPGAPHAFDLIVGSGPGRAFKRDVDDALSRMIQPNSSGGHLRTDT